MSWLQDIRRLFAKTASGIDGPARGDGVGIMFGMSTDEKVVRKYARKVGVPALVVSSNNDPEFGTAGRKRFRETMPLKDETTAAEIYRFILTQSLSPLIDVPVNRGPDAGRRNNLAQRAPAPKLLCFSKTKAAKGEEQPLAKVGVALRGNALTFAVTCSAAEHDDGMHWASGYGVKIEELANGAVCVMSEQGGSPERYNGDVADDKGMLSWAEKLIEGFADWPKANGKGEL